MYFSMKNIVFLGTLRKCFIEALLYFLIELERKDDYLYSEV